MAPELALAIKSEWSEIDRVRAAVIDFFEQRGIGLDLKDAMTMLINEAEKEVVKVMNQCKSL